MEALKLTVAAALLSLTVALPAAAQAPCGPTEQVRGVLENRYGEAVVDAFTREDGLLFEMWANMTTGSWTETVTSAADGITCLIRAGQNFPGAGDPA